MAGSPDPKPAAKKAKTPSGLKRKTSLRGYSTAKGSRSGETRTCAAEGCEGRFYNYPSRDERFCSRACAYAARGPRPAQERKARSAAMLGTRKGKANPNNRHGRRVGAHDRDRRRFKSGQAECQHQSCTGAELIRHEHHVVYEQHVRRADGDPFDGRNALRVCAACHTSHHRRGRVLSLTVLRDANFVFARELLGPAAYDYLRRRYAGDDPRLDALLAA